MPFAKKATPVSDGLDLRETIQAENRRRRAEKRETGRTMRSWAELVPERGLPLNFADFPYQAEWYSDAVAAAREVVWMKAAQVGMSGYAWRWAGRRAEQFGDRVIYFFPTDDDVTVFGDQRIEPSIQESVFLQSKIPSYYVRNKHLKRIGQGDLNLRGTQSKTAVQSVDADAIVFDEYDFLHQGNLAQAERRLAGSQAAGREPRTRRFGYPTLPGSGIHSRFLRTDQRVWHVVCGECGEVQSLSWEISMRWRTKPDGPIYRAGDDEFEDAEDVAEAWRVCRACDSSLEGGPIRNGRWIPMNPDATVIGYHVSRLIVPRTDLVELVRNSRKTKPFEIEAFYNNDLGIPWVPAEAALTEADVEAAAERGGALQLVYRGRFPLVAGFDVASERALSGWVDEILPTGETRAVWIGEPHNFMEVADLIGRFAPSMTVIDSMPERRQARGVAAQFPGAVVLAVYDARNDSDAFLYNPDKNLVKINRTEAIDAFMDSIRQGRRITLRTHPPKFVSQLLSPKRQTVLDSKQRPVREYVSTGSEGDDYAHAGVYALVAREMLALGVAVNLAVDAAEGAPVVDERFGFEDRVRY